MEKKYQVFISSTYTDLIEERREVMEALLQMNCFPVGMEYFNASDESQWEIIKKLIDDCDYYVLIVAGRYGSVDEATGKSYTQMEFEYAVSQGKTVLRFVHDKIGDLKADNVESTDEGKKKLNAFRQEVMKKYCKMWHTSDELKSQVILALNRQFSTNPQTGWIKADQVSSEQANKEILKLKEENEQLKATIAQYEEMSPVGIENLSQGDDVYPLSFYYRYDGDDYRATGYEVTWNEIFGLMAPYLVSECVEWALVNHFNDYITQKADSEFKNEVHYAKVDDSDFQNIKVQLIALGLITESVKKRSTKDQHTYWTLTKYGKKQMFMLKAIKK